MPSHLLEYLAPAFLVIFFVNWHVSSLIARQRRETSRIERKLDLLLQHLGIVTGNPKLPPDVEQLARSGQKIAAIKLLRERQQIGLAEAKAIVDDIAAN